MIGTVDSWLLYVRPSSPSPCPTSNARTRQNYTSTNGANGLHLTDLTNASRTLLLSLHTLQWDHSLLAFFDLPAA